MTYVVSAVISECRMLRRGDEMAWCSEEWITANGRIIPGCWAEDPGGPWRQPQAGGQAISPGWVDSLILTILALESPSLNRAVPPNPASVPGSGHLHHAVALCSLKCPCASDQVPWLLTRSYAPYYYENMVPVSTGAQHLWLGQAVDFNNVFLI